MFKCPVCGSVATTRTSHYLSDMVKRAYYACKNMECSSRFTTLEGVDKIMDNNPDIDRVKKLNNL